MRFLARWMFRLTILLVVLAVALVLLKDVLLKALIENRLRAATGMDARIGRIESGWGTPSVTLERLKLYNPAEYGGSAFLEITEMYLEYRWAGWDPRSIRAKLLRLDVAEIQIVENKAGRLNIVELQNRIEDGASGDAWGAKAVLGSVAQGVDLLNLSVGTVRFVSLTTPARNGVLELAVRNEIIPDVTSMDQVNARLLQVLLRRGISLSKMRGGLQLDKLPGLFSPAGPARK